MCSVSGGRRRHRGFTLVEVMLSAIVMATTLVGLLATLIQAYEINESARRRDQVRAVVQSLADDFSRMTITDPPSPFFKSSIVESGAGLTWTGSANDGTAMKFRLGNDPSAPEVTITSWVQQIDEDTGIPDNVPDISSTIGSEIVCRIRATWQLGRRPQELILWVVRADT